MNTAELHNISVKFSGEYINNRFKNGSDVEKHLVLNTIAHGFCMGARFRETAFKKTWKFWEKPPKTEEDIVNHSVRAAKDYILKKGMVGLPVDKNFLVRATVSYGFREGYNWRDGAAKTRVS
jgi:hypothetical protein